MSQNMSRKRPAPGAVPPGYQQLQPTNDIYPQSMNQLSNDQFLQWSQPGQIPHAYQEADTYTVNSNNYPQNGDQPSNQLSRRPMNQMVARPRYENAPSQPWQENANGAPPTGDSAWADDIEELEQKAQIAKKDSQAKRKQIPPFVQKLNSFLENGKNTELIRWSDDGNSFIVLDEDEFAKTLIPELFKHNNYASFVRQLNMYGFHKKVGLSDNSMRASERKNKSPSEYSNPYFRRGHPDLLWLIQKPKAAPTSKKGRKQDGEQIEDDPDEYLEDIAPPVNRPRPQLMLGHGDNTLSQEQVASVQRELQAIRHQQTQISRMMGALKRDQEQLYGQAATFQDQHNRHENSINAILTFLATVYNRSLQGHEGMQGIQNLFANAMPHDTSPGTVFDVADLGMENMSPDTTQPPKPFKRQPLLLTDGQQQGRVSTASPSSTNSPVIRHTRLSPQQTRSNLQARPGNIEELQESVANSPAPRPTSATSSRNPHTDMMSMIHNTNAQQGSTPSNQQDFNNVLSSLESAGGQTPLTTSQRADMLRMMNNSSATNNQSANSNLDNALINSTPPSGPANFGRQLQSTSADLDQLAKLQAEQDKSVQNLTNLLQPLSPSGSIPGIHDNQEVPPAPLDIDAFLNSTHDYFHDFNQDQNYDFGNDGMSNNQNLDFGNYQDNDELFGDLPPPTVVNQQSLGQQQQQPKAQNGESADFGYDGHADGGGRVESVASSEVTTPRSNADEQVGGAGKTLKVENGHGWGTKRSSVDDDYEDDEGDNKRRRRT